MGHNVFVKLTFTPCKIDTLLVKLTYTPYGIDINTVKFNTVTVKIDNVSVHTILTVKKLQSQRN